MPRVENKRIPAWERPERQRDFVWIEENVAAFWLIAIAACQASGRGAIVVNATILPLPGRGNPAGYVPQGETEL